ncbi:MAG: ATPase [Candidatus Korobacteraceae bacterium]
MRQTKTRRLALVLFCICLAPGMVSGQEHGASSSSSSTAQPEQTAKPDQVQSSTPQQGQAQNPNAEFSKELTKTSEAAAEEAGKRDAKVAMELKAEHSPVVSWIGRTIGIGPESAYVLSLIINFGILLAFFWVLLKGKIPQMFRERTATIRKGIQEAQAASADASRRLKAVEERLAKLDTEVAEIRTSAERDAATEEARIRQAAEEDKRKVVEAAETEIAAIARNARRELKGYAATLAVDLASRKIRVDEPTDQALVREFIDQLGKDGK